MLMYNEDILEALDQAKWRSPGRYDGRPICDRILPYYEAKVRPHRLGELIMRDVNYKYRNSKWTAEQRASG